VNTNISILRRSELETLNQYKEELKKKLAKSSNQKPFETFQEIFKSPLSTDFEQYLAVEQ